MLILFCLQAWAGPIEDLRPGEWYQVPDSRLDAVDPCPSNTCTYSAAEGVAAVMDDWSGGAYDTSRDQLLVWGGGHGGYAGNEVYAFDLDTLTWERLTDPSTDVGGDEASGYYPDGLPRARHTYDSIQYVPVIDALCAFGAAALYPSAHGASNADCLTLGTLGWERMSAPYSGGYSITAVDPTTGHVWQHPQGSYTWLAEFDPDTDGWTAHGSMWTEGAWLDYYHTADIDPGRRKLVAVGEGDVLTWDLDGGSTVAATTVSTTGDRTIADAAGPGFAWDSGTEQFVGWNGGASVYTFDLGTAGWTRLDPASTNTVTPTLPNSRGTYGRFRYSPRHNVFVVVNAVDEDVYLYRLSDGAGEDVPDPVADTLAPAAPSQLRAV